MRRRLPVVSDNNLIEGMSQLATDEETAGGASGAEGSIIKSYTGVSKKGYAPYNPHKKKRTK